ncbi:LysE family translocator [Bosea sp. AS-1]|uniref:LysE family translocator n=1 Tax=Bosea sp. AS-1 TaxID=2015316 RepID=UPI000B78A20D|nr:LysE family translocator [Bosea sp. AS-1]
MIEAMHLWLFFLFVFGIVIVPGMDMTVVLANALGGGRRDGLLATFGVMAGGVCHVVVGALGIGLVLQLWPAAFNLLLLAGAIYVAWLGFGLLRHGAAMQPVGKRRPGGAWPAFRSGILTNLLNPKAYLFMFAVFPQFLRPERGWIGLQAAALGLIIVATQLLVYGGLALAAAEARSAWRGGAAGIDRAGRAVGLLLMATAAYTLWKGWRGF